MKQKTYYLLRHGQTSASKHHFFYFFDFFSAGILPEARKSIEKIATFLQKIPSPYYVSSSFIRCRQTCEIIEKINGKKFTYDKRLNSYTMENPWEYVKRLQSVLKYLEGLPGEHIVMCTHGANIEVLKSLITKHKFSVVKNVFHLIFPIKTGKLLIIQGSKIREIDFSGN